MTPEVSAAGSEAVPVMEIVDDKVVDGLDVGDEIAIVGAVLSRMTVT